MGLDIYFHKTKVQNEQNIDKVYDADSKNYKKRVNRRIRYYIRELNKLVGSDEEYNDKYKKLVKYAKSNFQYNFMLSAITEKVSTPNQLKVWYTDIKNAITFPEVLYYRKVNFLFKFFRDNETLIDDCYCWVSKESATKLVEACQEVLSLKDYDKSNDVLPTCSGCFFGSINYDNYYYEDVEEVMNDFKRLLEGWKENERVYVIFSY